MLDLDPSMELILLIMMVMHYDSGMGNRLAQHLDIWMDSNVVHIMAQS